MNIQPGNSTRRKPERSAPSVDAGLSELLALLARVGQTALVVMLFSAVLYAYITLDNRIGSCKDQIRELKVKSGKLDREILALRAKEAHYSRREYVMAQVRRFRLPLVPTQSRQVRNMTVLSIEQASRTPLATGVFTATARTRTR